MTESKRRFTNVLVQPITEEIQAQWAMTRLSGNHEHIFLLDGFNEVKYGKTNKRRKTVDVLCGRCGRHLWTAPKVGTKRDQYGGILVND